MINKVEGLKFVENTVMTVSGHPTGVPKYGQIHKQLISIYEDLFGGSKMLDDFYSKKLGDEEYWNVLEKIYSWLKSRKWIGANIDKQVGKHKIPRYLYHVTTRANYDSMLRTGSIRASDPGGWGFGVYMIELQNMIKHYGNHNGYRGLERLLGQGRLHCDNELVLLKIPTSKLNASQLAIRNNSAYANKISSMIDCLGDSAINSKLYKQKKLGLEYIYPHNININNVTLIGAAKINPLRNSKLISDAEALDIWKTLTKGTPEHRAFEVIC